MSPRGKKHFPGEEAYRVLPACPHRWRWPDGGLVGRVCCWSRPFARRPGHRDIRGADAVAEGPGGARPGQGSPGRRPGGRVGRGLPRGCGHVAGRAAVFGPVASDPTVSCLIDTLAASRPGGPDRDSLRAGPSPQTGLAVGRRAAPDAGGRVSVDLDGVLVVAHSDKEDAAPTWKRTYGHHPLMAFVDHGSGGTGEPVSALLRPRNAASNTAADHITTARLVLAQLPPGSGTAGGPWSARIPRAAPTTSWPGWPDGGGGCPTRSAW